MSSDDPSESARSLRKLYVYFNFHSSSILHALLEIPVPNPLPYSRPPTRTQIPVEIEKREILSTQLPTQNLILQLKRGEYPDFMCCVQLASKFYFFGGEHDDLQHPLISEDVRLKLQDVQRDRYPRDVYFFDPADDKKENSLIPVTPMKTGKSKPLGFVVDGKIYVVGSTFKYRRGSEIKYHDLFEVYDPVSDKWSSLPNPSIRDEMTEWVGHAVLGRKVLLHARLPHNRQRLYCFDIEADKWIDYPNLPSYLTTFFGRRSEFVEGTLYGTDCHRKVRAMVPLAEEQVKLGKAEEKNILYFPYDVNEYVDSSCMGSHMDALSKFPRQLYSSSSLLHLGNGFFCFVMSGMPRLPGGFEKELIEDPEKRFVSVVIFQALGNKILPKQWRVPVPGPGQHRTTGFFSAKFIYSAHYHIKTPFPSDGEICGCFSLGSVLHFGDGSHPTSADSEKAPMSNLPSDPLTVPQSVSDVHFSKEGMPWLWQSLEDETDIDFITTARHIDHPCPRRLQDDMLAQEYPDVQSERTWDVELRPLIEQIKRLQDLQGEHEMTLRNLRMENMKLTNQRDLYWSLILQRCEVPSSSQPSNPSGCTPRIKTLLPLS